MKYYLLGTSGCHLCELAEDLLKESLVAETDVFVELIDIAEQTQWQAGYATRIPVLLHQESKQSLNWPFTKANIITFIAQHHD
jgi:Glutaredoxin-like domain (DUF836)